MKNIAIVLGMLSLSLSSVAQNKTSKRLSFGLDYVPTQYDQKSEYWEGAERRDITEQGLALNASIGYTFTSTDHISLAITKHRNTMETTYRDNDNLLYGFFDVFGLLTSGTLTTRDIKKYDQTVNSSSVTVALSYFNESQTNERTFIGAELGFGVRTYMRDVQRTVTTNYELTEIINESKTEQVANFKIMLRIRSKISPTMSIVGKIGVANTPVTLGLQYNL